jgi:hypothetical protein
MLKVLLFTFIGLASTGSGVFLSYLSINKPFLLIPSVPLLIIGIFLIIKASRKNEQLLINEDTSPLLPPQNFDNFKNIAEKNNQIVHEWIKESENKDKLKILEIAAAVEEEAKRTQANSG